MFRLRFYRKYTKWFLVFGGSLLMIVFLLPEQFGNQGGFSDQIIGRLDDGTRIYSSHQIDAQMELDFLNMLGFPLPREEDTGRPDAMTWLLLLRDADRLQIGTSNESVAQLLHGLQLTDGTDLSPELMNSDFMRQLRFTADDVYQAVRNWLVYVQYQELALGLGHVPLTHRIDGVVNRGQLLQAVQGMPQQNQMYMLSLLQQLDMSIIGEPRVSETAVRHVLYHRSSTVEVAMVKVDSEHYFDKIEQPTDAQLTELFNEYKDDLPGTSEPYGFGYAFPDRVKVEYLAVPLDRVIEQAKKDIDNSRLYEYYQKNRESFIDSEAMQQQRESTEQGAEGSASAEVKYLSFAGARDRILTELAYEDASNIADRMINAAISLMQEDMREKNVRDTTSGYKNTQKYSPAALNDIADKLQEQFKVRPVVVRHDREWLTVEDLRNLPGIGESMLMGGGQQAFPFETYIMSAREIAGDNADNPLHSLRLQEKVPTRKLIHFANDGTETRYVARIIEAQGQHSPQSLDEVREQVVTDARRLAAYRLLQEDASQWVNRANATEFLASLAQDIDTTVIRPQPFSHRTMFGEVPQLEVVGQSEKLVDAVFERIDAIQSRGGFNPPSPAVAPNLADRTFTVPVDRLQALMVVRIEDYQPMTESQYAMQSNQRGLNAYVLQAMTDDTFGPINLKDLKKRLGYRDEDGEQAEEDEPADATPRDSA